MAEHLDMSDLFGEDEEYRDASPPSSIAVL